MFAFGSKIFSQYNFITILSQKYLSVINKYVTVQVSSQCFHLALGSWKNTNLINIAHELNILSKETLKCPIQKNLLCNFFSGTKIRQQKEFRISYDIFMDVIHYFISILLQLV